MEVVALEKLSTFDHIVDNLYLGDIESATSHNIADYSIEIVVNVSNTRYEQFENVDYHNYDVNDESSENIQAFFDGFVTLIKNNPTKNILVHCQNSVSRSVTLVLAYLINRGSTLLEAYAFLKTTRTQYSCPNRGFLKQLSNYEIQLHGNISIDPILMFKNIRK